MLCLLDLIKNHFNYIANDSNLLIFFSFSEKRFFDQIMEFEVYLCSAEVLLLCVILLKMSFLEKLSLNLVAFDPFLHLRSEYITPS